MQGTRKIERQNLEEIAVQRKKREKRKKGKEENGSLTKRKWFCHDRNDLEKRKIKRRKTLILYFLSLFHQE